MFPNPALILTEFVALFCHSSQDDQDGCGTAVAVRDLMPFFFQGGGGGDDDMGDEAVVIHAFEKLQQQHRNKNIVSIDDNGFAWIDASEVIQAVNQDLEKTVYIVKLQ